MHQTIQTLLRWWKAHAWWEGQRLPISWPVSIGTSAGRGDPCPGAWALARFRTLVPRYGAHMEMLVNNGLNVKGVGQWLVFNGGFVLPCFWLAHFEDTLVTWVRLVRCSVSWPSTIPFGDPQVYIPILMTSTLIFFAHPSWYVAHNTLKTHVVWWDIWYMHGYTQWNHIK